MNTAAAKQTIKQCFQTLTDEQLHQYHLTHDYFSGRPLSKSQMSSGREEVIDMAAQKRQRNLDSLNELLYPTPTLGSVLGDSLAALKLTPEVSRIVVNASLKKPSEDLVNRAKNWFTQYQNEGLSALLPAQAEQLSEANVAIVKRGFSRNTVLIQNVCMLSPFWIRSPQDWDAQSGNSLLEHLFVQYEAPAFLKACWSRVSDDENVQWLLCYLLFVQGGSLKALASFFDWKVASNKLWHQLFSCPASMLPQDAVLYVEFKRLGGWDQDFATMMENGAYVINLLEPISEEGWDFWYDTCRWIISKQFDLSTDDLAKVLWWARHQLSEFAREGESYRLQGRSLPKVLESIAEYESEQRMIQQARARMAARARQVSMARNEERDRLREEDRIRNEARQLLLANQYNDYDDYEPINVSWSSHHWDWSMTAHGKDWCFTELTNTQSLYAEGEAMYHCVGGYSMVCVDGEAAIFSLRCNGSRIATIEVCPHDRSLSQVQGKYNEEPAKQAMVVVNAWLRRVVESR